MAKVAKIAERKGPPAVSLRSIGDSIEKYIGANGGFAGLPIF